MEFDKDKWDAYVKKQGGVEAVAQNAIKNKIIKSIYSYSDKYVLTRFKCDFDPIVFNTDTILFMALGLNIQNFITSEPVQPVQIVTGIEALRSLCDGKILKDLRSDVFYKIEKNLFVFKSVDNTWQKAYSYIDYILIDDFEVCNAEND